MRKTKFKLSTRLCIAPKKLDFIALEKGVVTFKEHAYLDSQYGFKALEDNILLAKTPFNILPKEQNKIDDNIIAQQVLSFLNGSMPDAEKALFGVMHSQVLAKVIPNHPALLNGTALLRVLFDKDNASLLKKTKQGAALAAFQSAELLTNEQILEDFLKGVEEDLKALKVLLQCAESIHEEVQNYRDNLTKYPAITCLLVNKLADIAAMLPNNQGQLLALFDKFVEGYSPSQGEMMLVLNDFSDQLNEVFSLIDDSDIILSLCVQFKGDNDLGPKDLQDLIRAINTLDKAQDKKLLFNIAVYLLNNDKGYVLGNGVGNDFTKLCAIAKENPLLINTLTTFYERPPYPSLTNIIEIHHTANEASKAADKTYEGQVKLLADDFDKEPCHRELSSNGFDVNVAKSQLDFFQGYDASPEKLARFKSKIDAMREKSSSELLDIIKSFSAEQEKEKPDLEMLVAVCAELLYRSKGKDSLGLDGKPKPGSSMEINTTQYLAILSFLETNGHVTSQIGTGEGKSRIMMISNVCQWALGNTVDFVTSDAELATRDYVEYQSFFNMVGAKTSMVFAHSSPSSYQVGGINFSDPSNLSLFRNKAKSAGGGYLGIAPEKDKRTLLLDEADKTYFDLANTRFNFSKEGDESIQNMDWVYPLLMAYFEQDLVNVDEKVSRLKTISPLTLFYKDIDESRKNFLSFASSECSKKDYMRLLALSEEQIEQWQVSAVTAAELEFQKDFVIAKDELISTPKGPKIASEAQLLFANRVAKGSKLSFGVQQCLHARLNRLRRNTASISNEVFKSALNSCEHDFYLAGEKQIIYSSTSKNLIDDYSKGTVKAVTGTAGSKIERAEVKMLYQKMKFIDVPRAKEMKRQDNGITLHKDEKAQFDSIVKQITAAQKKNQPILLIAENDEESEILYRKLSGIFTRDLQRIHSQLSSKEETLKLKEAGSPKMITVSTDMVGRGTDIALQEKTLPEGKTSSAKEFGLKVMVTYLPRVRDLQQILGRSGRMGDEGETSLVLNEQHLLKQLNKEKLPQEYFSHAEAFFEREQAKMDRKNQLERLVKGFIGDFNMTLQNKFFNEILTQVPSESKGGVSNCWTSYADKSSKHWNAV